MISRPARGLLFLALTLVLAIPPAIAGRGGRGGGEEEGVAAAEERVAAVAGCLAAAVAGCPAAAEEVGACLGAQG